MVSGLAVAKSLAFWMALSNSMVSRIQRSVVHQVGLLVD